MYNEFDIELDPRDSFLVVSLDNVLNEGIWTISGGDVSMA